MDALDARLLRALLLPPSAGISATRLARAIGTTVDTVKARLARLESEGVIVGYETLPNLSMLGLRIYAYLARVRDEATKDDVVASLDGIETLVAMYDYHGPALCIEFAHADDADLASKLKRITELTGDDRLTMFLDRTLPPPARSLSPLDWRILRALRASPRASAPELAEAVGVSARTVKRHHDRMAKSGAFITLPLLDPSRASGLLLVELLFYLRPGTERAARVALTREFEAQSIFAYEPSTPSLGHFNILAFAHSAAEVDLLRRRGAGVPGVERAEAWLFRRFLDRGRWIDEALEHQARLAVA